MIMTPNYGWKWYLQGLGQAYKECRTQMNRGQAIQWLWLARPFPKSEREE